VTFFGIFLTPVFYVVIRWLTTRLRPNASFPGRHHAAPDGENGAPVPLAQRAPSAPTTSH
jgi:hypothetical protein